MTLGGQASFDETMLPITAYELEDRLRRYKVGTSPKVDPWGMQLQVTYNGSSACGLTRAQAVEYIAWLDGGGRGTYAQFKTPPDVAAREKAEREAAALDAEMRAVLREAKVSQKVRKAIDYLLAKG